MAATDASIIFQANSVTLKYDRCFILLKTGSCACIVVLYIKYGFIVPFHIQEHAPVKIISEVHR